MKLGFILPQIGNAASADAIKTAAKRAEELGYDSLWTTDRLFYPTDPQTPYGGMPGVPIPEPYKTSFDPLQTLVFAAAHTSRVRLGVSVLVMGFYNPVVLARSLTALDIFSGGRLTISLGQGWSKDEFDATGTTLEHRGGRADEFVQVLKTIWTTDPVEHHGKWFQVPKAIMQPKPVQKPHPPIYMAAYSPGAMQRIGAQADGFNPIGLPNPEQWQGIKDMAKAAGRNPDALKLLVRANVNLTDQPVPDAGRWSFVGSLDQIKGDIAAARSMGVDELFFDPTFSPAGETLDGYLKAMQQLREIAR